MKKNGSNRVRELSTPAENAIRIGTHVFSCDPARGGLNCRIHAARVDICEFIECESVHHRHADPFELAACLYRFNICN